MVGGWIRATDAAEGKNSTEGTERKTHLSERGIGAGITTCCDIVSNYGLNAVNK